MTMRCKNILGHISASYQRKVHFCSLVYLFLCTTHKFVNMVLAREVIPKYHRLEGLKTKICRSSGGWEVRDQGASRLAAWQGPSFWLADGHPF